MLYKNFILILVFTSSILPVVAADLNQRIDQLAAQVESKVIQLRRHFHEHPELSNREFQTAEKIAEVLRQLDIEVETEVAHTGVVGVLRGGKPGPVVALRADMDGLPVKERVDLPFASEATGEYRGEEVPVMHACGHDTHMAMLLGAAEVLSQIREDLPGTVKFIFQPAEEGAPSGEEGGAELMVKEGVLKDPDVDVIFGSHISSLVDAGTITYRPGGTLASADGLYIKVKGKQTHGSTPWTGADPITSAAQIIMGLQTIVSRQTELTTAAAVISIGSIRGGIRGNIIPEEVEMIGTIRALNTDMQDKLHRDIRRVAQTIARAMNTEAEVEIDQGYPVTYNDPELTREMLPTLKKVAGQENVKLVPAITGAEDFSFYQKEVPGLFIFVGGKPPEVAVEDAPPHHTPDFFIDESGLILGTRALAHLAVAYLENHSP